MKLQERIDEIIGSLLWHCERESVSLSVKNYIKLLLSKLQELKAHHDFERFILDHRMNKPKVKQISWHKYGDYFGDYFEGLTPIGTYRTYKLSENEWTLILVDRGAGKVSCTSLEQAKQRSQDHFEQLILSSLEEL